MGKIKRNLVESAMHYHKIVLLVVGCLILFGIFGLINVNKNEFPNFTVRQGVVVAIYPGASPEEVEEEVTKPLEDYIFTYKEVNKEKTISYSRNGMCIIQVELNDDFDEKDIFWSKFKLGIQDFKSKLPSDVIALKVKDDFGDTSALLITIESNEKTYRELNNYVKDLQDSLRLIESVGRMTVYGMQKEQISVYFDSKKLSQYKISDSYIAANMLANKFSTNAGTQNGDGYQRPIYVSRSLNQVRDVEDMIIYNAPDGTNLKIKDVAKVVKEYPANTSFVTNNGKKCLVLSVEMKQGRNITDMGEDIYKTLDKFQETLPEEVSIFRITDQAKVVSDSVWNFLKELLIAIFAVMLVVVILMPLRVAQVSAIVIPISIFISLALFFAFDIELNTVTLAALITTLGLIVDDAIVILDNHVDLLGEGHSRWYSATRSATMFTKSIFTATLAISVTFFPFLFFTTGMFRDFLLTFPWAITIVLLVSFFVALLVVPYLQYVFIRKPLGERKFDVLGKVQYWYDKLIDRCFQHPKLTFATGVVSVILGVLLIATSNIKIMPNADRNQFAVEIYLPVGTTLSKTALVADSLEHILQKDDRIVSVASFKGMSSPRFQTSYAPKLAGNNYAQFIVNTDGNSATVECLQEYREKLAALFPEAYVRCKQLSYSKTDYPVEVRIIGSDMEKVRKVNDDVLAVMRNMDKLLLVQSDLREQQISTTITVNQTHAARMNINNNDVKRMLTMRYYPDGLPIGTVWNGDYDMEVKMIGERANKASLKDIADEQIPIYLGQRSVPVRQIADVKAQWHEGQIAHRAGLRTVTVMSDVKDGVNATKACKEVEKAVHEVKLPAGVKIEMGGETAENAKNIPQLISALLVSTVIIFFILLWHFKKISTALLILGSLLLCIFGTGFGIKVQGVDFSLTCFLGIISLMGIMVRNSVIMYDYASELQHEGKLTSSEAIYLSAKRRMRPIFLTSAAASMGVIPMILGKSSLWMPMGAVICYGALTTMVFILTVLPVTYAYLYDKKLDRNPKSSLSKRAIASLLCLFGFSLTMNAQTYDLQQCKQLALQNNIETKKAESKIAQSKQQRNEVFTKFFPQISAKGWAFKSNKDLINFDYSLAQLVPTSMLSILPTETAMALAPSLQETKNVSLLDRVYGAGLFAQQPIFMGGRIVNSYRLSKVGLEASEIQKEQSAYQVEKQTEEYFWKLVQLQEKMKTVKALQERLNSVMHDVTTAVKAGLKERNDLLQVQLKQNELEKNEADLTNNIELLKMLLAQYMGVESNSFEINAPDITNASSDILTLRQDHQTALHSTPEYRLMEKNVEAKKLEKDLAVGASLPTVALGASYTYNDFYDVKKTSTASIFATVSVPITDWWGGSHAIKRKKMAEKIAKEEMTSNSEKLVILMQKNWNDVVTAQKQVDISKKSIEQSKENLRLNTVYYKAGTNSISDLLEAQQLYQQACDDYVRDYTELQQKILAYKQSVGIK